MVAAVVVFVGENHIAAEERSATLPRQAGAYIIKNSLRLRR